MNTLGHTPTHVVLYVHMHTYTQTLASGSFQHASWPHVLYARWTLQSSDQWPRWVELPGLTQASCFLQSGSSRGL